MSFEFEERLSDSPFVEAVWRTHTHAPMVFPSAAASHGEIVITKYQGITTLSIRGPETKASIAESPPDAEIFGIVLKHGSFLPDYLPAALMDRNDVHLPETGHQNRVWLQSAAWEIPTFDNADTFIQRLARQQLITQDFVVEAVLQNRPLDLSIRTVRRHFLRATGMTHTYLRQIQRANYARGLLRQGMSILDTVFEAGYFDQPHLTRALKHFVGETPAQIAVDYALMSVLYRNPQEAESILIPD